MILTPHIGGSTEEAQADIGAFVSNKLATYLTEGNTTLSVNLPSVSLPPHGEGHRLVYLHRNTPGVLAQVNSVLAEHSVNVEGQLLATRGEYGYLLTDIGIDFTPELINQLAALPQTVRLRVIA